MRRGFDSQASTAVPTAEAEQAYQRLISRGPSWGDRGRETLVWEGLHVSWESLVSPLPCGPGFSGVMGVSMFYDHNLYWFQRLFLRPKAVTARLRRKRRWMKHPKR